MEFSDLSPDKVLVAGDIHGDSYNWEHTFFPTAQRVGAKAILQVGDFGYWPQFEEGQDYIDYVIEYSAKLKLPVVWLDGNHENFDALEAIGAYDADEPFQMGDYLWYLPRGYAWRWAGRKLLALGGAYSVDKKSLLDQEKYRGHRTLWWPQETIAEYQLDRALMAGKIDVLCCHDAPDGHSFGNVRFFPEGQRNREILRRVVEICRPRLVFHGHFHYPYVREREDPRHTIVGLDHGNFGAEESMMLLDLTTMTFAPVRAGE